MRDVWPEIVQTFLAPQHEEFLCALVEAAHRRHERGGNLALVEIGDVYVSLGWALDRPDAYRVTEALERRGLVRAFKSTGYSITLRPTYAGAVRVTQELATKWQAKLNALLSEGETTTVDLKRELSLDGEGEGRARTRRSWAGHHEGQR